MRLEGGGRGRSWIGRLAAAVHGTKFVIWVFVKMKQVCFWTANHEVIRKTILYTRLMLLQLA